jgi:hypothetical protein
MNLKISRDENHKSLPGLAEEPEEQMGQSVMQRTDCAAAARAEPSKGPSRCNGNYLQGRLFASEINTTG